VGKRKVRKPPAEPTELMSKLSDEKLNWELEHVWSAYLRHLDESRRLVRVWHQLLEEQRRRNER
jgi:hypothetical protein